MKNRRALKQITIELSNRCAQACSFCSSISTRADDTSLSFDNVRSVLIEVASLGGVTVAFSGGEPLLYADFLPCVDFASQLGLDTYLYTSGILLNSDNKLQSLDLERSIQLKESGIHHIYLSIHGASSVTHDEVCGIPGSFELVMQSLKILISVGAIVGIHYLVARNNYIEKLDAADKLFKLSIYDFKPMKLVLQGRALDTRDELSLSPQDKIMLLEQMQSLYLRFGNKISLGCFWRETLELLNDKEIFISECKMGKNILTVKADGSVVPCGANKFQVIGNIHQSTLSDIWFNSQILQTASLHQHSMCAL